MVCKNCGGHCMHHSLCGSFSHCAPSVQSVISKALWVPYRDFARVPPTLVCSLASDAMVSERSHVCWYKTQSLNLCSGHPMGLMSLH